MISNILFLNKIAGLNAVVFHCLWLLLNVCLPVSMLPYQFQRVKCWYFYNKYISTWSVITKEILKALFKSCYQGYYLDMLLKAVIKGKVFKLLKEQILYQWSLEFGTSNIKSHHKGGNACLLLNNFSSWNKKKYALNHNWIKMKNKCLCIIWKIDKLPLKTNYITK